MLAVAFGCASVVAIDQCRAQRCKGSRWAPVVIRGIEQALAHYQADRGEACPASLEELVRLGYLYKIPIDEKRRPLRFVCPGRHNPDGADISSVGRDSIFGTADDVTNWDRDSR